MGCLCRCGTARQPTGAGCLSGPLRCEHVACCRATCCGVAARRRDAVEVAGRAAVSRPGSRLGTRQGQQSVLMYGRLWPARTPVLAATSRGCLGRASQARREWPSSGADTRAVSRQRVSALLTRTPRCCSRHRSPPWPPGWVMSRASTGSRHWATVSIPAPWRQVREAARGGAALPTRGRLVPAMVGTAVVQRRQLTRQQPEFLRRQLPRGTRGVVAMEKLSCR